MLQINRESERIGVDGKPHTWEWIEREFRKRFKKEIADELDNLINIELKGRNDRKHLATLRWCRNGLHRWMVATPVELKAVKEKWDKKYKALNEDEAFRQKIKEAFDYKNKRKKLVEVAKWLNVKTCPYCNMQYTLYASAFEDGKLEEMAKFQFDHFYGQTEYPMLSMSLYNLIPSCASCNQGKSDSVKLDLAFHPYRAAIKDTFRFRVSDPKRLIMEIDTNDIDIELKSRIPQEKFNEFNNAFHLKTLYRRHRDVAREVFVKAYLCEYYGYPSNFSFLQDEQLMERIVKGFYPDEDDIDKRPLTKLEQDLWMQAKGWKGLRRYGKMIEKHT